MKSLFIINPKAKGKRALRTWTKIKDLLDEQKVAYDYRFTEEVNDATSITKDALYKGCYHTIVAVGGDGTINEVVNGFFGDSGKPIDSECAFAFVPCGTGCDFAKTFQNPPDWESFFKASMSGNARMIDVGLVQMSDRGTKKRYIRYFINVAGFGIESEVVYRVNRSSKLFGGRLSFLIATVRSLISYRPVEVKISVDGVSQYSGRVLNVAVANGRYFGAGMCISPDSSPFDGNLDCIIIEPDRPIEMMKGLRKIYSGDHLDLEGVKAIKGKDLFVESEVPMVIDIDGEDTYFLPAQFRLIEGAIKIKVPEQ